LKSALIVYSVDYPDEDVVEAKEWFDHAAISESDRLKITRTNAEKLFRF
jgi:gamma-resorcylate decarboxylase